MPSLKNTLLNIEALDDGVWQTFYTDPETGLEIRAKVASATSPNYTKAVSKITRRYRSELRGVGQNIPAELMNKIQREAAGEALLTDWTGIEDDNGTTITFSKEKAIEFMTDRAYTEFFEWVTEVASNRSLFRKEAIDHAAKN